MIKEIIKPQSQRHTIEIPKEYLNQDIMILVMPLAADEAKAGDRLNIIKKTSGILSKRNIDPIEWQKKIRSEWDNRNEIPA